jgi:uncharacterized protein YbjT (DUF2867 family)
MRLTVFGGTSPTGQHLIEQALQTGHTVTALARNPAKLAARDGLTVIEGQLTDTQAIAGAVKDAEAVISLLGPPSKPALGRVDVAPILDGYRNIVAAMKTHGVRRLVALGTPSITDPADRREPAFSILVAVGKRIRPTAYRTMAGIGRIVRASGLDWTIVRVPLLTDGPRTERISVRAVGDKGGIRLSRANAAAYFLQQAEDITRVGQAPLITDIRPPSGRGHGDHRHRAPARSRPAQRPAALNPPIHAHTPGVSSCAH